MLSYIEGYCGYACNICGKWFKSTRLPIMSEKICFTCNQKLMNQKENKKDVYKICDYMR